MLPSSPTNQINVPSLKLPMSQSPISFHPHKLKFQILIQDLIYTLMSEQSESKLCPSMLQPEKGDLWEAGVECK